MTTVLVAFEVNAKVAAAYLEHFNEVDLNVLLKGQVEKIGNSTLNMKRTRAIMASITAGDIQGLDADAIVVAYEAKQEAARVEAVRLEEEAKVEASK